VIDASEEKPERIAKGKPVVLVEVC